MFVFDMCIHINECLLYIKCHVKISPTLNIDQILPSGIVSRNGWERWDHYMPTSRMGVTGQNIQYCGLLTCFSVVLKLYATNKAMVREQIMMELSLKLLCQPKIIMKSICEHGRNSQVNSDPTMICFSLLFRFPQKNNFIGSLDHTSIFCILWNYYYSL